jgi:hypothetical protein
MAKSETISVGLAGLYNRYQEGNITDKKTEVLVNFYRAETELEILRELKEISNQIARLGNIQEGI